MINIWINVSIHLVRLYIHHFTSLKDIYVTSATFKSASNLFGVEGGFIAYFWPWIWEKRCGVYVFQSGRFYWTWSVAHIFPPQAWFCLLRSRIKLHPCCVTISSKSEGGGRLTGLRKLWKPWNPPVGPRSPQPCPRIIETMTSYQGEGMFADLHTCLQLSQASLWLGRPFQWHRWLALFILLTCLPLCSWNQTQWLSGSLG